MPGSIMAPGGLAHFMENMSSVVKVYDICLRKRERSRCLEVNVTHGLPGASGAPRGCSVCTGPRELGSGTMCPPSAPISTCVSALLRDIFVGNHPQPPSAF